MLFFKIVIAIFIGIPGLILFLLGLIRKSPGYWISGGLMTLLSFIIVISAVIRFVNHTRSFMKNAYYHSIHISRQDNKETPEETAWNGSSVNNSVNGFIKGNDNKLTMITVKIDRTLENKGIVMEKIEDYSPASIKKNSIALRLTFTENFNDIITLTAYTPENTEIESVIRNYNTIKGNTNSIAFDFLQTTAFSEFGYCILH